MRTPLFTFSFAAAVLLAASPTVHAQPANPPAGGAHSTTPNNSIAGISIGGPYGVLTDQQRASYQNNMKAIRPRITELESKLRAARQELTEAGVGATFNEALVQQKALAVAQIEAEMTVLRMRAFSQVQPPLTAEQIQQVRSNQTGPMRPLNRRDIERPLVHPTPGSTNQDVNGLPPKQ
jgi:Spy/CpxP family protein refolding chaperone